MKNKQTDLLKPKFKVGDIIVATGVAYRSLKVTAIGESCYVVIDCSDTFSGEFLLNFSTIDNAYERVQLNIKLDDALTDIKDVLEYFSLHLDAQERASIFKMIKARLTNLAAEETR